MPGLSVLCAQQLLRRLHNQVHTVGRGPNKAREEGDLLKRPCGVSPDGPALESDCQQQDALGPQGCFQGPCPARHLLYTSPLDDAHHQSIVISQVLPDPTNLQPQAALMSGYAV